MADKKNDKKDSNSSAHQKTIDELAREAMKAIKDSDTRDEQLEEQRAKEKEQALKQEAENKVKAKLRRLQAKEDKEAKLEEIKEAIISNFMVTWDNPDEKGITYQGIYNEEVLFKIKRGITLFHLYVVNEEVLVEDWKRNSHTSMHIFDLKEKADKILKNSISEKKRIKEEKIKSMIILSKSSYLSKDGTIKEGEEIDGKFYAPKDDV